MLAKWGAFDASSMHPRFFARLCMFARVVCAPPSLDFEHAKSCVSFNDLPYVFSFLRIDSLEGCFGSNEKILSLLFFHSSFSSSFLVYFKSVLEFDSIKDSLDWKRDEDRFKYERDGASIGE